MDDPIVTSHPFLIHLKNREGRPSDQEIAENPRHYTCLSPHVSRILLLNSTQKFQCTPEAPGFVDGRGRLNWKRLDRTELVKIDDSVELPENLRSHTDGEWFIASIKVHKVALECHKFITSRGSDATFFPTALGIKYGSHIRRIHVEYLRTGNVLLGFAGLVSLFERLLGDLFYTLEESSEPNAKLRRKPPPLIRDLLQTPEMKAVLGESPLFLLQVLIGSPRSLNLRNIVWHGFSAPQEVHPGFYCLLLLLQLDMVERGFPGVQGDLIHRELRELDSLPPSDFDFGLGQMSILSNYQLGRDGSMTSQQKTLKMKLEGVFRTSLFVVPGRSEVLIQALDYYSRALEDPYAVFFCLVLALPTLEHCLRVFWIHENDMPAPLLCADSFRYYTVIDMFLETDVNEDTMGVDALTTGSADKTPSGTGQMSSPNGSGEASSSSQTFPAFDVVIPVLARFGSPASTDPYSTSQVTSSNTSPSKRYNRLMEVLGIPLMTAMNDIFLFPLGPRPRDRISHGDVDPTKIGSLTASRCMEIIIALCLKFMPHTSIDDSPQPSSFEPFDRCKNYFDSFVACWHPRTLLQRQLRGPSQISLSQWKQVILTIPFRDPEREEDTEKTERRKEFEDEIHQIHLVEVSLSSKTLELSSSGEFTTYDFQININEHMDANRLHQSTGEPSKTIDSFDFLNCPASVVSSFDALRKLAQDVQALIEMWLDRFKTQKTQVESGQASTRLAATFYKLLGILNVSTAFFSLLLQAIQLGLLSQTFSQKHVRRIATAVSQLKQKILTNAWEDSVRLMMSILPNIEVLVSS